MAHLATKRYEYWGQLGILTALCGGGLIMGSLLSYIPLLSKINIADLQGDAAADIIKKLMVPENATILRWMQFITTLFLFFLPPVIYAKVCHKDAFKHLGFKPAVNPRSVVLTVLIMLSCIPLVDALQQLTELLPWSKEMLLTFKKAEEDYNKQVMAIARMNGLQDYIISLIMVAFLPAMFEEVLFRGALQNLLSRWFKMPLLAIILTAIFFSAVHGSYLGFLSRFALGFVLGWFYYRTGNIWLNIIAHFFNNALPVTFLYIASKSGQKMDASQLNTHAPIWVTLLSVLIVIGLFIIFDKVSQKEIDRPGEEELMPGYVNNDNPFAPTTN